MLLGEHAVLYGRRCLVCAVNQRTTIKVVQNSNRKIRIFSVIGEYEGDLLNLEIDTRFQFLLFSIKAYYKKTTGFDCYIESDFSHKVGLGSSAAITAAILGAIAIMQNTNIDNSILFEQGLSIIHKVQGTGSGADLAASVFGGIISYTTGPRDIHKLPGSFPISVVYSGEKTPTTRVIQIVKEFRKSHVGLFDRIFDLMEKSVELAQDAIEHSDWKKLGEIFNINQGLMDAIGVNTPNLADINFRMRQDKNIFGAKISGSGLGDCVVGVGTMSDKKMPFQIIPMKISQQGLLIE